MKLPRPQFQRTAGFSIVETMIGALVASIVLSGLMIGTVALQRAFSASDLLATTQADLIRVADYMAKDIRSATTVTPGTTSSVILTATAGDVVNRNGTPSDLTDDLINSPTIGRTGAVYGTNPVTIRYLRSGSRVLREVTRVEGGATTVSTTWIADNVDNIAVAVDGSGTATVSSDSAMYYKIPKADYKTSSLSLVMATRPRNATP